MRNLFTLVVLFVVGLCLGVAIASVLPLSRVSAQQIDRTIAIALYTRDGEVVHQADIPTFSPNPEVILWQDRVFWQFGVADDVVRYKEAFAYTVQ